MKLSFFSFEVIAEDFQIHFYPKSRLWVVPFLMRKKVPKKHIEITSFIPDQVYFSENSLIYTCSGIVITSGKIHIDSNITSIICLSSDGDKNIELFFTFRSRLVLQYRANHKNYNIAHTQNFLHIILSHKVL